MRTKWITVLGQPWDPNPRTQAVVFGAWAASKSLDGDGFRVTDMTTGRAIPKDMVDGLNLVDAARIASYLNRRIGPAPSFDHDNWEHNKQAVAFKYALDACIAESFDREIDRG